MAPEHRIMIATLIPLFTFLYFYAVMEDVLSPPARLPNLKKYLKYFSFIVYVGLVIFLGIDVLTMLML
jgi:hypothetical protein